MYYCQKKKIIDCFRTNKFHHFTMFTVLNLITNDSKCINTIEVFFLSF